MIEQIIYFKDLIQNLAGLSEDVVTSILEDGNKNLWVGTWGGGLNKIKFSTLKQNYSIGRIEIYKRSSENNQSISSDIVQDIYEDSKGNLWIGTEDGLNLYNPKQNNFFHYMHNSDDNKSISDNRIQSSCIIEDKFGYLWVGTWNGLNRLKISDNTENLRTNKL